MKKTSIFKILIIMIISLALILTGCGGKGKGGEDFVKPQNNIVEKKQVEKNEQNRQTEEGQEDEKGELTLKEDSKEEKDMNNKELVEEESKKEESKKEESKKDENKKDKNREEDKQEKSKELAPIEVEKDAKNILKVEGSVAKELNLSLDKLKAKNNLIFKGDFFSINNFGTKNHTQFKGINLWELLENEAQISSSAAAVEIIAIDGYKMEFTLEEVKRQDYIDETNLDAKFPMIIAWEENGQEYDPEDGPPFKLIIGQKEPGDVNKPQWVSKIDKIIVK